MSTPAPKLYRGTRIDVTFDGSRCMHFAECIRGAPEVFDASRRPWVLPDAAPVDLVADVVRRCPTGALQYTSDEIGPEQGESPVVLMRLASGPIIVRGETVVRSEDGSQDVRETRMVACGCGRTTRSPYCSGACVAPHDL